MPKKLSAAQVEAYRRDGYVFPLAAFPASEIAACKQRLDVIMAAEGGVLSRRTNQKPHLLFPWLADMIRHPSIVDAVEDILGPDILVWGSGFFHKPARDPAFVSWHQDSTYWGLSSPDVVTAWVAFTPSTPESGCMQVLPGSHAIDQLPHRDTFHGSNLLTRGQEIAVDVDRSKAVDIVLQPGEMSLHHVRLAHGSEPNRADHSRTGYAIRYIPTSIRQVVGDRDSATLVRGVDRFHHFDPEPRPKVDFDPETLAFHTQMVERTTGILYAGAAQKRDMGDSRSLVGRTG
jgi:non-heme Fe2+,alpha-ketoglutarate-dependent halogenase